MKTKTYFAFRVDVWDSAANSIVEHIAGVDDFRGGRSDLPGGGCALASGADHLTARRARGGEKLGVLARFGARVVMKSWTGE